MTAEHLIRLARYAEASDISKMSRDYVEHGLGWNWTATRVLRSMRDRSSNVAVIHAGGSLLGFGIMRYGDRTAHLLLLAVHSARRRRGFGAALLHWLEGPARVAGIEKIRLETRADNTAAQHFYRGQGYQEVARIPGYYQGLEDGVRLEKRLWTPIAERGLQ